MTKQRKVVYEIVTSSNDHMTAEEIYNKAKKVIPNISIGTVYRNLSVLSLEEKIRRVSVSDRADKFDGRINRHDHLVCESCGSLKDVELPGIKEYIEKILESKLTGYQLNLRYVCKKCEKEAVK